jgi:GTP-binding protein
VQAAGGHTNLAHLSHQRHWKAARGEHGEGSDRFGRAGEDLLIEVPPGTLVRDRDRGHLLRDLKEPGDQVIVARGGKGGHGNAYYKSATNRAPRQREKGHPGEERWIVLELKVIADVGLIGLPNAGKSTLLSRISRAHPEIADYPFTTKYPNLGTVVTDEHNFIVADIPGLIEGAHAGHGLGHEFLRHVERTHLLVHLVEGMPLDGSDPLQNYRTIRNELAQYSPALAERPEVLVVTKLDVPGADEARIRMERELRGDVLGLSAVTGQGIPQLIYRLVERLGDRSDRGARSTPATVPAPLAEGMPATIPVSDAVAGD